MAGRIEGMDSLVDFQVFSEWDFEKNVGVDPSLVGPGSHKNYWWKCMYGHQWQSSPERRIRNGNDCPYCANRKVWEGFNDLESQYPEVATTWSDGNALPANAVLATSKSQFEWSCVLGHRWSDSPSNRTILGKDCPFCSGHRVWKGFNDLATLHPEVAKHWSNVNGQSADEVLVVNSREAFFRCELGHEWNCQLYIQVREQSCPICMDRIVDDNFNSLKFLHPKLASELDSSMGPQPDASEILGRNNRLSFNWVCSAGHKEKRPVQFRIQIGCWTCYRAQLGQQDVQVAQVSFLMETWDGLSNELSPESCPVSANQKLSWTCSLGHTWRQTPWIRLSRWSGCPVCSNKVIQVGFNDLATLRPDIAAEWDHDKNALLPTEVGVGSNKVAHFKCIKSHTWTAIINNRCRGRNGGTDCPYCSNREIWVGFNDLCTTHPELARELHPDQVIRANCTELQFGQKDAVIWTCALNHAWSVPPRYRVSGTRLNGCPYCGGQALLQGFNDLASVRPDLIAEWDYKKNWPVTPQTIIRGSGRVFAWICKRGHHFEATVKGRMAAKIACPECMGIELHAEYIAKLEERLPTLLLEWDREANSMTLDSALRSGNKKAKFSWKCSRCAEDFQQQIVKRVSVNQGCPYCANLKIKPGLNDLATSNPALASEWDWDLNHPLTPSDIPSHTSRKVWWICASQHKFKASVAHRSNGRGCPSCSQGGFDPLKPGWLYLLRHETWGLLQIGISNVIDNRLAKHKKSGWQIVDVKGPLDGYWVMEMETSILGHLKDLGVDVGSHAVGRFDGFTEAWTQDLWPAGDLSGLFSMVYRAEALEREGGPLE